MVWIEDQTSHNIPLRQSLSQARARPKSLFNSAKAKREKEAAEGKFEARRGSFMKFKERSRLHSIQAYKMEKLQQ